MATEVCEACTGRPKDWPGSDPKCGFPNGLAFSSDNWMCATVIGLRNFVYDWHSGQPVSSKADYRYHDDQHVATIDLNDIELPSGAARSLWMTWYKSRGRTEAMWLLDEDQPPRAPTEADLVAIINALKE